MHNEDIQIHGMCKHGNQFECETTSFTSKTSPAKTHHGMHWSHMITKGWDALTLVSRK